MSRFIVFIDDLQDNGELIDCFDGQKVAKNPVVTIADADSCETCLHSCTIELYGEYYEKCEINFGKVESDEALPEIKEGTLRKLLLANEFEIDLPQKFAKDPIALRAVQKLNLLLRWTIKIHYGEQIEKLPILEVNLPRVISLR